MAALLLIGPILGSLLDSASAVENPSEAGVSRDTGSPASLWVTIPIVAWHGIPGEFATPERYRELAGAGFTMRLVPDGRAVFTRLHLKCAAQAGIKLILMDDRMLVDLAAVAADFKDDPALGMYFLRDEPGTDVFSLLAKVSGVLAKVDPQHAAYINLLPSRSTSS